MIWEAFKNAFKIEELRKRILFTLLGILVFRIGCHIPTPGVNGEALRQVFERAGGTLFSLVDLFSGGALRRMSIFALGVMPYITASIIMQLLIAVVPSLEQIYREGEVGRRKITQYSRMLTVALAFVQGFMLAVGLESGSLFGMRMPNLVFNPGWGFRLTTAMTITVGSVFLMWLGEQMTERGIGNGISIIIFAGIVSRVPYAIGMLFEMTGREGALSPFDVVVLVVLLVAVTAAVVQLTQGQRRVPIQHARRIMGRRVYSGQSTYLPLRVNQAGVIPIIFASSILLFPATITQFMRGGAVKNFVDVYFSPRSFLYNALYFLLVVFFTFFYTAIIFDTNQIADNMRKYGSFIPGIRPGKPTADYLDKIMTRITLPGALALATVAVFPRLLMAFMNIPWIIASFFGGTALIIMVGVALDTVRQIESHLLMRHYEGFVKKGKIKGRY